MRIPRGRAPAADGVLLVDKPQGLTSHDVVARVRRMAATRKVGHAGTLDPMATGLLVLGVGRATRLLTYVVGADKTYVATVRLGVATTTDDAEGQAADAPGASFDVVQERLTEALGRLTGVISQVPSAVSAIKVDGKRAYARVRDGEEVELAAREVTVHELDVVGEPRAAVVPPGEPGEGTSVVDVDVRVRCSSGTYVRAIARDLGAELGTGGHLTALRRTAVGPFDVDEGATLQAMADAIAEEIEEAPGEESGDGAGDGAGDRSGPGERLAARPTPEEPGAGVLTTLPAGTLARRLFRVRELTEAETTAVRYGQRIGPSGGKTDDSAESAVASTGGVATDADAEAPGASVVAAFAPAGHLVALLADERGRARPVLVLDPA
ncbi:tRNA pseudouridine(55) synthase TruB [Georgenia sp. Z1491]|uniref:tRNA pseudouridine(55) synthase TruB n=1 Tax=Georgenia sp. Z1491 TaxID=3416707 RepID=UPI003CF09198